LNMLFLRASALRPLPARNLHHRHISDSANHARWQPSTASCRTPCSCLLHMSAAQPAVRHMPCDTARWCGAACVRAILTGASHPQPGITASTGLRRRHACAPCKCEVVGRHVAVAIVVGCRVGDRGRLAVSGPGDDQRAVRRPGHHELQDEGEGRAGLPARRASAGRLAVRSAAVPVAVSGLDHCGVRVCVLGALQSPSSAGRSARMPGSAMAPRRARNQARKARQGAGAQRAGAGRACGTWWPGQRAP